MFTMSYEMIEFRNVKEDDWADIEKELKALAGRMIKHGIFG